MTEFRVNKFIWESFESALEGAGKKFVKDLASTLEVSPDDLVKIIFNKTNKIKVCLHDWNDESALCSTKFQEGSTIIPCDNAKMCGKEICRECFMRNPVGFNQPNYTNLHELEAIELEENSDDNDDDNNISLDKNIWIDNNGIVYDNKIPIGEYNEDTEEINYWN